LAKQLGISEDLPKWQLKREVEKKLIENTQAQLLLELKKNITQ